jgi:predicted transglutaminase-like cysteine proteinase
MPNAGLRRFFLGRSWARPQMWAALTLACVLATILSRPAAAQLANAGIAESLRNLALQHNAQPFGFETEILKTGGLWRKWHAVERRLPAETAIIEQCRRDHESCPPEARRFLAIVERALTRTGRARIGEINRAVNLLIRPVDDNTQYGVDDLWTTPLTTFTRGAGDCEDYAIAKYVALREAGIAPEDLRLVVVHDRRSREYHAVAAVRLEESWLILDNRNLGLHADIELDHFEPLFAIDAEGVKRLAARPREAAPPAVVATVQASTMPIDNL